MRILLRTDGGAGIGLGHLQRCLSLAEALQRNGFTPLFALFGDDAAGKRIRAAGYSWQFLDAQPSKDDDVAWTAGFAKQLNCRSVVVDSYMVDDGYLGALRERGLWVGAIDDLNEYPFPCQMVVSFGPHAPSAGYRSSSGDTHFLLGPQYSILRPEYWDSPRPARSADVRNVVVSTGGADPGNVMPAWLRALDGVDHDFGVTAVVGPFFANPDAVHEAAAACARTVRVIAAPPMMRPLLARADLAVTAAGQTIYECAALGVPAVAVEIAPNQRPQLDAFVAAGAMVSAGRASDAEAPGRIAAAVTWLCANADERGALSKTSTGLVDPRGAVTVAREITRASAVQDTP